jgi:hypothetical protein
MFRTNLQGSKTEQAYMGKTYRQIIVPYAELSLEKRRIILKIQPLTGILKWKDNHFQIECIQGTRNQLGQEGVLSLIKRRGGKHAKIRDTREQLSPDLDTGSEVWAWVDN